MMSLPRNRSGATASSDRFRLLVEIRDHHQHAAAAEVLGQLVQRLLQAARAVPGFSRSSTCSTVSMCLADGGTCSTTSLSKAHEADAIALVVHEVGQARGQDARVVELGDAAAAVVHRLRHVEQHREVHVRLGFVLLDVVAVGPRPQPPVHAADVVARHVAAMLGEVDRRAEVRRLVQAVDEAVDDRARHELQVPDAREHRGIHEPRAGDGALRCPSAALIYIPERGSGTVSSRRSTMASVVTPSDCAWKLVMMRWRSTGCASARMSSKLTW